MPQCMPARREEKMLLDYWTWLIMMPFTNWQHCLSLGLPSVRRPKRECLNIVVGKSTSGMSQDSYFFQSGCSYKQQPLKLWERPEFNIDRMITSTATHHGLWPSPCHTYVHYAKCIIWKILWTPPLLGLSDSKSHSEAPLIAGRLSLWHQSGGSLQKIQGCWVVSRNK